MCKWTICFEVIQAYMCLTEEIVWSKSSYAVAEEQEQSQNVNSKAQGHLTGTFWLHTIHMIVVC